jgi:hypothetical protein
LRFQGTNFSFLASYQTKSIISTLFDVLFDSRNVCHCMKSLSQPQLPRKILAILAAYGAQDPALVKGIHGIIAGLGVPFQLLIVRNDLTPTVSPQSPGWIFGTGTTSSRSERPGVRPTPPKTKALPPTGKATAGIEPIAIPGDNTQFEFSAWQAGLNSAAAQNFSPDMFLLMTTAFINADRSSMPVFSPDVIKRLCAEKGVAGRVRKLPCRVSWQNMDLQAYVQTHLVLLHRDTVSALGSVVSVKSPDAFVLPRFSPHPFTDHDIWKHGFDDYLFYMLTQRWHGHGMPYTEVNYPFFRRKVLSILNELILTARVRTLGHPIFNLTPLPWLFDSPWLFPFPGRPIALFQGIRSAVFRIFRL